MNALKVEIHVANSLLTKLSAFAS
jgi:hypothetical protein